MHFTFFERFVICVLLGVLIFLAFCSLNERTQDISNLSIFNIPKLNNKAVIAEPEEITYNIQEKEDDQAKEADISSNAAPIFTAHGFVSFERLEKEVFRPLGMRIVETGVLPKLEYIEEPKCADVFSSWLAKSAAYNESGTPPKVIPNNMEGNFTLNGYIHLKKGYRDDRSGVKSVKWANIYDLVEKDVDNFKNYSSNYGKVGIAVHTAMKAYSLEGRVGVVIGSRSPWVESFALRNGAEQVTTVEYMKIEVVGTDKVLYKHPVEMAKEAKKYFSFYDFAASFSSMEHSGLGRYGDVPDPIGDIREMLKVRCLLKDGGLFFFGVPSGPDCLHWNLHRIYGRIRLAIMFVGFELLDVFDSDLSSPIEMTESDFGPRARLCSPTRHPVFVLRKTNESINT